MGSPSKTRLRMTLIGVGAACIAVAAAADQIGVGRHPGFGWKQIALSVVGIAIILGGLFMESAPADENSEDEKQGP